MKADFLLLVSPNLNLRRPVTVIVHRVGIQAPFADRTVQLHLNGFVMLGELVTQNVE